MTGARKFRFKEINIFIPQAQSDHADCFCKLVHMYPMISNILGSLVIGLLQFMELIKEDMHHYIYEGLSPKLNINKSPFTLCQIGRGLEHTGMECWKRGSWQSIKIQQMDGRSMTFAHKFNAMISCHPLHIIERMYFKWMDTTYLHVFKFYLECDLKFQYAVGRGSP